MRPPPLLLLVLVLAAVAYTADPTDAEKGIASWYGYPYHGRRAAGGEIYDMEGLTAAHKSLPFGTWVRVVNLTNEKTVDVRITDRGPFVEGRIIDLSRAAARAIGLLDPGVTPVRLELIGTQERGGPVEARLAPPAAAVVGGVLYAVQAGAFRDRGNAERCLTEMQKNYGQAHLVYQEERGLWRVLVGSGNSMEKAAALSKRVREGSDTAAAFVVRLDASRGADRPAPKAAREISAE